MSHISEIALDEDLKPGEYSFYGHGAGSAVFSRISGQTFTCEFLLGLE